MSTKKIIHAWQDSEYRKSLSDEELAGLPMNPIGYIELSDDDLSEVMGAAQSGASVGCNTKTCVTTRGNSRNPCQSC